MTNIEHADRIETLFKTNQAKFDILEQLDRFGDVNDPIFLRGELERNSFLLAHERIDNEKRTKRVH